MKNLLSIVLALVVCNIPSLAQEKVIKDTSFQVSGNCGQCKSRIEKALTIEEVKFARWDKRKKLLTVRYNSSSISLDSLQKRVAAVGHDTQKYSASNEVYQTLPTCCLYRGKHGTH